MKHRWFIWSSNGKDYHITQDTSKCPKNVNASPLSDSTVQNLDRFKKMMEDKGCTVTKDD